MASNSAKNSLAGRVFPFFASARPCRIPSSVGVGGNIENGRNQSDNNLAYLREAKQADDSRRSTNRYLTSKSHRVVRFGRAGCASVRLRVVDTSVRPRSRTRITVLCSTSTMRAVARIELPSTKAVTIWICFSSGRTFVRLVFPAKQADNPFQGSAGGLPRVLDLPRHQLALAAGFTTGLTSTSCYLLVGRESRHPP